MGIIKLKFFIKIVGILIIQNVIIYNPACFAANPSIQNDSGCLAPNLQMKNSSFRNILADQQTDTRLSYFGDGQVRDILKIHNVGERIKTLFSGDVDSNKFPAVYTVFDQTSRSPQALETGAEVLKKIYNDPQRPPFIRVRAAFWLYEIYGRMLPESKKETVQQDPVTKVYLNLSAKSYYNGGFDIISKEVQKLVDDLAVTPDGRSLHAKTLNEYVHCIPEGVKSVHVDQPVRIELTSGVGSDVFILILMKPEESGSCNFSIKVENPKTGNMGEPFEVVINVIDTPVIEIESKDYGATERITDLKDVYNYSANPDGKDFGLIHATLVASGLISPHFKDTDITLADVLRKLTGKDGTGIHICTEMKGVLQGTGLAGSAAVEAGLLLAIMKFSGLTEFPETDELTHKDRMMAVGLSIMAEHLKGIGGGVQDPGSVFPGIKTVSGRANPNVAVDGIPGAFLPEVEPLSVSNDMKKMLQERVVMIDAGMRLSAGDAISSWTVAYFLGDQQVKDARTRSNEIHKMQVKLLTGNYDNTDELTAAFQQIAELEAEDWGLRANVLSPPSNHEGIRELLHRMNEYFSNKYRQQEQDSGGHSFYYDTTGARGGAGCLFFLAPWVDKNDFQIQALEIIQGVHEWLKTKDHKVRGEQRQYPAWEKKLFTLPYVYPWEFSVTGSRAAVINSDDSINGKSQVLTLSQAVGQAI